MLLIDDSIIKLFTVHQPSDIKTDGSSRFLLHVLLHVSCITQDAEEDTRCPALLLLAARGGHAPRALAPHASLASDMQAVT